MDETFPVICIKPDSDSINNNSVVPQAPSKQDPNGLQQDGVSQTLVSKDIAGEDQQLSTSCYGGFVGERKPTTTPTHRSIVKTEPAAMENITGFDDHVGKSINQPGTLKWIPQCSDEPNKPITWVAQHFQLSQDDSELLLQNYNSVKGEINGNANEVVGMRQSKYISNMLSHDNKMDCVAERDNQASVKTENIDLKAECIQQILIAKSKSPRRGEESHAVCDSNWKMGCDDNGIVTDHIRQGMNSNTPMVKAEKEQTETGLTTEHIRISHVRSCAKELAADTKRMTEADTSHPGPYKQTGGDENPCESPTSQAGQPTTTAVDEDPSEKQQELVSSSYGSRTVNNTCETETMDCNGNADSKVENAEKQNAETELLSDVTSHDSEHESEQQSVTESKMDFDDSDTDRDEMRPSTYTNEDTLSLASVTHTTVTKPADSGINPIRSCYVLLTRVDAAEQIVKSNKQHVTRSRAAEARCQKTEKGHRKPETHRCRVCKMSCSSKADLKTHMATHRGTKPHRCVVCDKHFLDKNNLTKHMMIHSGERPYKCLHCDKAFTQRCHLTDHTRQHTGERPYKCPVCDKSFCQKGGLTKHTRTHSDEKPFQCSVCGKSFAFKGRLTQHTRTHTGERPYKCPVCGKSFGHSGVLAKHKLVHTGEKPYECSMCRQLFSEQGALAKHMRAHSGEKPYACTVCGKGFAARASLKNHYRLHTGEKPYLCSVCGESYARKEYLALHFRLHTGEKLFECTVCSKTFLRKCAFEVHRRVHTGEKPYLCSVCGKCFAEKGGLKTHMRVHTKDKPFQCPVCRKSFASGYYLIVHKQKHCKNVKVVMDIEKSRI